MARIRLLIVDDHTLFRQGLISMLRSEPGFEVVGEAGDGEGVSRLAQELRPDVVLMDLKMRRIEGVEACRSLLSIMPAARIVILTVSADDEDVFAAIRAGARGYVLKNADTEELLSVIRRVHQGDAVLSPSVTLPVLEALRNVTLLPAAEAPLTTREQEVLRLLVEGADNKEIARVLSVSINTAKTHVAHILTKLNLRSRNDIPRYAHRTAPRA